MLAVVAFANSMASAELLKNFKYDGQVEVNAYNVNNTDFNKNVDDKTGFVDTRVMLNAGFDLNEDVNAVVSVVKNNRQYGAASESATSNALRTNGILDNMFFEQAYLNLKNVLGIDHKLGRQYYGQAGDVVIYYGPKLWPYTGLTATSNPMFVNAIDGWTGWYKFGGLGLNWDLNAIIGKAKQDATPLVAPSDDINIAGINAKTMFRDINLNGYVYEKTDKNTVPGKSDYLEVVGLRANYAIPRVKNLNVAGEFDMNMGKNTGVATEMKHRGFAYKLNADYSMDLRGKLGFDAEYFFASGDETVNSTDKAFSAINGDYRPGIIYGGGFYTSAAVGSGLNTYNLGANWTPARIEKLNVAAKYYHFSADKKAGLAKTNLGNEADLVATWTHSDNVNLKGYYAMFMPEKDNNAGMDDAQTMMGAAFSVKF
jgi:hypothetical protein